MSHCATAFLPDFTALVAAGALASLIYSLNDVLILRLCACVCVCVGVCVCVCLLVFHFLTGVVLDDVFTLCCSFESSFSCLWGFIVVKLHTVGFPCLRLASFMELRGYRDRWLQFVRSTCEMPPPN